MAHLFDPTTKDFLASPDPRIAANAAQTGMEQMSAQMSTWALVQHNADGTHNIPASGVTSGLLSLARGGTFADLSKTGGAHHYLAQTTQGGPITVQQPLAADLSDYATGTWTPVIGGSTSTSGQTYAVQYGSYTKAGKIVTVQFAVGLSAKGTITGGVQLQGLPFAVANNYGGLHLAYWTNSATSFVWMGLFIRASQTYATIVAATAATTNSGNSLTTTDISNTFTLEGGGTYLTS